MDLQAKNIVVCRQGKVILDNVSFHIPPNTLTAIIGPNGAGKTTLMRALSGERPDEGQVLINGEGLYTNPEYWLQHIGYVPVDNILHDHLTLQDALLYVGRLRLPNVPDDQIAKRVDKLLTEFEFPPHDSRRKRLTKDLSSGERKRANICSELIIDPDILMLDEPTSNLDPNAEFNLMYLLASYAHEYQKTILVITHTLNTIDLCDEIIFIENSRLSATGKPQEVLNALEAAEGATSKEISFKSTFYRWAQIFEKTKTREEDRRKYQPKAQAKKTHNSPKSRRFYVAAPWLYQYRLLFNRYTKIRLGDKWSLLGTLLAGLSGFLFFTLPGNTFVKPYDISERALALNQARQSVYVISLVVTLLGMITSYTEISKEYRIYSHERLKGLLPSAYFLSKWTWLTFAVGIVAPIFLLFFIVLVYQQPLPGFPEPRIGDSIGWWEKLTSYQLVGLLTSHVSWLVLITLILSCITSVTLGLLISCMAGDGGKGYLYLSFSVVFVVLFSGLIRNPKLESLIDTLSFLSTGKWGYEGIASSISIYCWFDSWRFDEFNSTGHLLSIWLALGVFILIASFLSITVLHLRDPWSKKWVNLTSLLAKRKIGFVIFLSILTLLISYTIFLRSLSYDYHTLNYWSRSEYGGTNAYQYANVQRAQDPNMLEYWSGTISQSWCGNP